MKKKRVEVVWEDSAAPATGFWRPADETLNPVVVHSVGYVHERNARKLVLVSGYHTKPKRVAGMEVIPMSAVRKVTRLRGKR